MIRYTTVTYSYIHMMMMMLLMMMIIMCSVVRATLYYINIAIVGWGRGGEGN